ncbi:hypothetical protein Pfo_026604 [Paulownia fortunei]|nr:hypothetical protein Pfo_026604 [Paulownia fortunei]
MQSELPGSSAPLQPMASGLSMSPALSFSYNVLNSSAGLSSGQPLSASTNIRANGTQEKGAIAYAPAFAQSAFQPAVTNSSHSATHFASNNFNNMATWMPPVPTFQVPTGTPNTPLTPGTPGIASSSASPSNTTVQPSSVDSTAPLRTFRPTTTMLSNPTIQHQAVTLYPSPSPPGVWLQPQQITGFARPSFSPYAAVIPGPYTMPARGMPPLSVALPNIQPPGVYPPVSSVGAPTSSVASGGQATVGLGQADIPPGTDNSKHVCNAATKNETSTREPVDAWTEHRAETGIVYYYNALTGESTYEKPSGFKGESDKATVQPNPISWEKLAGTDWTLVTTNDGKRYYYNSTTQISSWQIPSEVTKLRKKQDADATKAQSVSVTNTNIVTEKGSAPVSLSTPAADTGGRDATVIRSSSVFGTSSALDLIKKKLQDSGTPASTSPGPALLGAVALDLNGSKTLEATIKGPENENNKDKNNGVSDSSSDSEDDDRGPTKEECLLQFKEMLKECGVAPFSKWDKELPKIVFDPRFKAVPSHSARRALFEHYVRTRAEEERKEKRAAQKAALEDKFFNIQDIYHNTDYHTFKMKWGDDPRFRAWIGKKEKRAQAERAAAISNFKLMLQDKGDITSSSRWSKVKDSLKSDLRYKSVKHEDREKLFNEYVAELKAAEEEVERKANAKQDEEEKLKERERALRKRKEREEQEVERVRLKALRKEAAESYQALLVETIKDPQASWTESKTKLEKDPQGRAANPHLDESNLEKLFREHVKSLLERCMLEFRALLTEVITAEAAAQETEDGKTIITSWSTAKQLLKNDHRYNKVPRKERESLWHRHAEEIQRKQKLMNDQEAEKHAEGKTRSPVDSGKYMSGSRRAHVRR